MSPWSDGVDGAPPPSSEGRASTRTYPGAGSTVVIGLTGPIGCGKSTIAGWLAELGAVVVDADVVAREVVEQGSAALDAVGREFGPAVVLADGTLDRQALGRIVFADPAALARLEEIVHPAVRPRILAAIAAGKDAGAPAVVVEAIKLLEGGLAELCDEVWLVTCAPADQRERLQRRGVTSADAEQRIAAQGDLVPRLSARANRMIETAGSSAETRRRVSTAWELARARFETAAERGPEYHSGK